MTGYEDAVAWLEGNAPDWLIEEAETSLRPSKLGPTTAIVHLVQRDWALRAALGRGTVRLTGEGVTLREAAFHAVGGLTG